MAIIFNSVMIFNLLKVVEEAMGNITDYNTTAFASIFGGILLKILG